MELSGVTAYEVFEGITSKINDRDVCHPVIKGHTVVKMSHVYQPSVHKGGMLVLMDSSFSNGGDIEEGGVVIVGDGSHCNNIFIAGGTLIVDGGSVNQIMMDTDAKLIVKNGSASFIFGSEFADVEVGELGKLTYCQLIEGAKFTNNGGSAKNVVIAKPVN